MRTGIFLMCLLTASTMALPAASQDETNSALNELLEADRAFARHSQEHGAKAAWGAYMHPRGKILPLGDQPIEGLPAIVASFDDWPEGGSIDWYPVDGGVAESGELGWTWGRYIFTAPDESGEPQESHGKYLNVWQRDESGVWKVLIDTGTTNPPPESD